MRAQDLTPPSVGILPWGGPFTTASVNVTITWCDNVDLNRFSRSITLNGSTVTNSFNYVNGSDPGCGSYATSTGTLSLNMGDNTLVATICDLSENCGTSSAVFTRGTYAVAVTPDNQSVGVPVSTSTSYSFLVKNTGTLYATFNLTPTCSGAISNCSAPSSVSLTGGSQTPVAVSFTSGAAGTTGTIKLKATVSGSTETDSGWVNTSAQYLTVSTAFNTFEQQGPALCAASCLAAATAVSTVPYFSLGQPRSVVLVYNGDQVAARPFVFADVSLQSGASGFQEYWFEAKDSVGAYLTFVNGDTKLRFVPTNTSQAVRLTGQFDAAARGYGTGVFPITLIVTAKYASGVEIQSFPTKFMVLNERLSPIARGWTVAGLQRVYAQGDGALLAGGEGSALFFTSCGANCYTAPTGEFSALASSGSGTGLTYTRSYPDSSMAVFNYVGRITKLIGRLQDTVTFEYDGSWRLTRIYDPFRTNGTGVHLYTSLSYGTAGLSSIQEPGPFQTQSGGRLTGVTVAADSTLTAFTDPDNVSTRFGYDGQRRLSKVINRRGDTTAFYYQAVTWKLDSLLSPRFPIDPRLYGSGQTGQLVTRYRSWQTAGMPTTSTVTTPATPVEADTIRAAITAPGGHVTAFTVNRWGQALVTTERPGTPLARVTTVYRTEVRPDSIRRHEGGVDRFWYTGPYLTSQQPAGQSRQYLRYGGFAQVDSVWGDPGSSVVAQRIFLGLRGRVDSVRSASQYKTKFTYDARQRVLTAQDPLGRTSSYHYDAVFGNEDSTLAPGNRFTRVRFDGYGRDTAGHANTLPWARTLYDVLNRVVKTLHDGQGDTTTFTYDSLYLRQVRDAKGQVYTFAYNPLGLPSQRTDPAGASETFYYNLEGLQTTWVNRRADTVATTYDALQRPLSVSGRQVVTRSFAYDSTGRKAAAWNAYVRDSTFLSPTGWTDSIVTRFVADPSKRFRIYYKPNAVELLDSVHIAGTGIGAVFAARRYVWNQATQTLDTVRLNGIPVNQAYNGALVLASVGLPAGVTRTVNSTTTNQLYESVYSSAPVNQELWRAWRYDSLNRVTEAYANAVSPDKQRYVFRYDSLGRLVQVADSILANACISSDPDYGGRWCSSTQAIFQSNGSYGYDALGNMTSVSDVSGTGAPTYASGNRLAGWPGYTFGNDVAGNRTWKVKSTAPNDTTRYFWSADGLLDSVKVTAGGTPVRTIQYDYNAAGQLVRKRVNGAAASYFLWDRGQLVAELSSTFGRVGEYAYYPGADRPIAVMHGTTSVTSTEYYQLDAQGTVWGLVSDSGAVTKVSLTEPWGFGSSSPPGDGNRLGWKALVYEGDSTQLYYVRARWYDPRTKRFMTEDPAGLAGGLNPYAFAENDPVNGRDPTGLMMCAIDEFCHWDPVGLGGGVVNPRGNGGSGGEDVCRGWLVVVDGWTEGCIPELDALPGLLADLGLYIPQSGDPIWMGGYDDQFLDENNHFMTRVKFYANDIYHIQRSGPAIPWGRTFFALTIDLDPAQILADPNVAWYHGLMSASYRWYQVTAKVVHGGVWAIVQYIVQ